MRVYAISDVHIDYADNWKWVLAIDKDRHKQDTFIVAGDVTHDLKKLRDFFREVKVRFASVFYVPGNHELWVRPPDGDKNSIQKFEQILAICAEEGIMTKPMKVGEDQKVWIVPLFSWYHPSFSITLGHDYPIEGWSDFYCCKWPEEALNKEPKAPAMPHGSPEEYFLNLNTENVHEYDAPVISFSHFLPRVELLPLISTVDFLSLIAGTKKLETQIRSIGSTIHIFGHTHINCNRVYDGIRYIQLSRKYPRERVGAPNRNYHVEDFEDYIIWNEAENS